MHEPELLAAEPAADGDAVRLRWRDGFEERLPAIWFRDNQDAVFDATTGQRRKSLFESNCEIGIASVALDAQALRIEWRDGTASYIGRPRLVARRCTIEAPRLWQTQDDLPQLDPVPAASFLTGDAGLREALQRLRRFGIVLLSGAAARSGVVEELVSRFGFVRETNYGRLFDVRTQPVPENLAYTAEALDLHTDNPYREPVPTLQLLHAIRADDEGGETFFVDGAAHARALAEVEPAAFAMLAHTPVWFRYAAPDGAVFEACRPVISPDAAGAPCAVHLNHRSLAPLTLSADKVAAWYDAYLVFYRRVHRLEARLSLHLRPGDAVIFDNRRILHGRTAYRPGANGRWLQGCYADIDGARATLARLTAAAQEPSR